MMQYIIPAIGLFAVLSLGFYVFMVIYASYCIYDRTLKRKSKDQWGRQVSIPNEYTLKMDEIGMEWQRSHDKYRHDVHIENCGLNLYGEYYDFGHDKAVIILSGRTESLRYGYYFSIPYERAGLNVLVIDPRAHGLSDGVYNTVGFEESKDALAWAEYLHNTFKVRSIVFHGICIGASAGIHAITSGDCPEYIDALVTEGMFPRFAESMKNNLIERKRLMFPILHCIDFWMKRYTGHSMKKGPIDVIVQMKKPLLMLQSKEDKFSKAEFAVKMFDLCPSNEKHLVLFEKGAHSMLRITDTEKYDNEIEKFLKIVYKTQLQA